LYEQFYGLKENPFRLTPDPSFICMTPQHQEALSGLIYSVCTRPGLTVLVGEAGTGKTTLLYSLLGMLEKRKYVTAVCTNPTLTRAEFYDVLMIKFGVQCESTLKSRQLAALEESICQNRAEGRMSVLVVDEAQRLSPELLEEVRLLLNMETATEKLLQIIIAGQPELEEILRQPQLRQLKQRVSSICRLKPLNMQELKVYLHHRLTQAGLSTQSLFPPQTIDSLYIYTRGIPRLINSLCDAALQTGFAMQSPVITTAIIDEVAGDLDLKPPSGEEEEVQPQGILEHTSEEIVHEKNQVPEKPVTEGTLQNGKNGTARLEIRIPMENYTRRQQSLGFFAGLIERWK
jgi:general secretion pathway protein A